MVASQDTASLPDQPVVLSSVLLQQLIDERLDRYFGNGEQESSHTHTRGFGEERAMGSQITTVKDNGQASESNQEESHNIKDLHDDNNGSNSTVVNHVSGSDDGTKKSSGSQHGGGGGGQQGQGQGGEGTRRRSSLTVPDHYSILKHRQHDGVNQDGDEMQNDVIVYTDEDIYDGPVNAVLILIV